MSPERSQTSNLNYPKTNELISQVVRLFLNFPVYKNLYICQSNQFSAQANLYRSIGESDNYSYSSSGRSKSPAAYMLGTASSSKRDLEIAKTGKETGNLLLLEFSFRCRS